MQSVSKMLKALPTVEKKRDHWDKVVADRIIQLGVLQETGVPKALLTCIANETDGGDCPVCKKAWREIEFDNRFGLGRYFKPACYCYPICPWCGNYLWEEHLSGSLKRDNYDMLCPHCTWALERGDQKRWGRGWEENIESTMRQDRYKKARGAIGATLWK